MQRAANLKGNARKAVVARKKATHKAGHKTRLEVAAPVHNAANDKNKLSLRKCSSVANAPPAQFTPYQSQSGVAMVFCSCARASIEAQDLSTSRIELPLSRRFSNKHVK